ncbi:hypothetical protein IFR05_005495 [Cadophora sp. M221]|nr:hypothetical protein IFR05_005495 [Cadophora sp. M221]
MPRIPGSHSRGGLAATDISATFAHAAEQDIESATINAAAHIFLSSITLIGEFLAKTKRYRERLSGAGSGTVMSDSWQRMDWVLFKKDGLKSLRDALQLRLANINVLLATAQLFVSQRMEERLKLTVHISHGIMPDHVAQFQEKSVESSSHCLPPKYVAHVPESEAVDENPLVIEIDPTSDILVEDSTAEAPVTAGIDIEPVSKHLILSHMANSTCQSAVEESNVALRAECVTFSNNYPAERDEASLPTVLPETTFQEGCETSSVKDSPLPQGAITDGVKLQSQLEVFLSHTGNLGRERQEPVRFKDAVGRKFTFPYNLCATWAVLLSTRNFTT